MAKVKPADENEPRSFSWLGKNAARKEQQTKIVKAAFYAVQVFYSFFIM